MLGGKKLLPDSGISQRVEKVGHEVHDELGERDVERAVVERQRRRRGKLDVYAGQVPTARLDERRRGIDRCDAVTGVPNVAAPGTTSLITRA